MPGYQRPDWDNLQRDYEAQRQKQQAMQRMMALLDQQQQQRRAAEVGGRQWNPNAFMRSAFDLGGEYMGMDFGSLGPQNYLNPAMREQDAPYSPKGQPGYLTEPVRARRRR